MNNALNAMVHHRNIHNHNFDVINAALIKREKETKCIIAKFPRKRTDP